MKRLTVEVVLSALSNRYPGAKTSLRWTTPLELLVATILSAQCTDKRVNLVTQSLFRKYRSPQDYLRVPASELECDIHSCGTYRMKTKAIRESCRMIIEQFHGKVPQTMEEMMTLRGVGRKTASVVLSSAFGLEKGIAVDTHVFRVSRRLGIARGKTPAAVERILMKKTPEKEWSHLSHLLVSLGREICIARKPRCPECPFKLVCPSSTVRRNG
ncbi:MAG: endonuclease III [Candidatus Peribacteraceae bacterium]|nr:endonuclease III [Candidatus Peribacteraceae bacterium]